MQALVFFGSKQQSAKIAKVVLSEAEVLQAYQRPRAHRRRQGADSSVAHANLTEEELCQRRHRPTCHRAGQCSHALVTDQVAAEVQAPQLGERFGAQQCRGEGRNALAADGVLAEVEQNDRREASGRGTVCQHAHIGVVQRSVRPRKVARAFLIGIAASLAKAGVELTQATQAAKLPAA